MKRTLAMVLAALALSTAVASAQTVRSAFGIKLYGCNVVQNGDSTNGVWVNYTNTRAMEANEVDFLVRYQGQPYIMVDKGSFTQFAQIQHSLKNSLNGVPWAGQTPGYCRVYRVVWANGTISKP